MLQARGEGDLALEPFERDLAEHFVGQHFHHDATAERDFGGNEHARHAPAAQLLFEGVGVAQGALQLFAEDGGGHCGRS